MIVKKNRNEYDLIEIKDKKIYKLKNWEKLMAIARLYAKYDETGFSPNLQAY